MRTFENIPYLILVNFGLWFLFSKVNEQTWDSVVEEHSELIQALIFLDDMTWDAVLDDLNDDTEDVKLANEV